MPEDIVLKISTLLNDQALSDADRKTTLRAIIAQNWGDLPTFSTLKNGPRIEETQKSGIGTGIAMMFDYKGEKAVLMGEAGPHYQAAKPDIDLALDTNPAYTIPGGFAVLTHREGSAFVETNDKQPETPQMTAAREAEEEFTKPDGTPLLSIDPDRLMPMDMTSFRAGPGVLTVGGFLMELTLEEVEIVTAHVQKMNNDADFRADSIAHTVNPDTDLPEIANLQILKLRDLAEGKHRLLNADQISLFERLHAFTQRYQRIDQPRATAPTNYVTKMKSLDELAGHVHQLRAQGQGNARIGITSGVFDILHPGHFSFLEDAKTQCDHLIVIIASDRTVTEQKGPDKPFVNEHKRAQNIASITMSDNVIISDEPYHETILQAIGADVMFKGDDYADKTIIGADLVGEVILIPCAEKEFYSSREFARRIKEGQGDQAPPWVPQ